jgi:PHD/YefM family antitoxin component YafN of YafNO toxin-antitoxin module
MQTVKGVQFVTDAEGHKVAVVLDLQEWGELWEDIYDNMLAAERAEESGMTLDEFEAELRNEGLLSE